MFYDYFNDTIDALNSDAQNELTLSEPQKYCGMNTSETQG